MVDVKGYEKSNEGTFLTIKAVEALPLDKRVGVIMPGSDWKEFDKDGVKVKKPFITVSINQVMYEWTLSKTASGTLAAELGTTDTDRWVGSKVKFLINGSGDKRYVTATVLAPPESV
jgi:hypothetical protein